ncbi:hypothetical protein AAC387_Pa08g1416 [Persea americana]
MAADSSRLRTPLLLARQRLSCPQSKAFLTFLPSFRIHVKRQARKRVQKTIPLSCHLGDEMRKMGPTSPIPARTMSGDVARCSHVTVGPTCRTVARSPNHHPYKYVSGPKAHHFRK